MHSDPRVRRVGWAAVIIQGMSNCLGQTLESWKRHREKLMNSLEPTGGWMGTLGEGEPNTVGRAELIAFVVAAESTRGDVVYITDYEILKKRQDEGLAHTTSWARWQSRALVEDVSCPEIEARILHSTVAASAHCGRRHHHENHDMALVFGNELADARPKQAASDAALRGATAEQVAWVDALAWQVQRRIVEANMQASKATPTVLTSCERGLRRGTVRNRPAVTFRELRRSRQRWRCQACKRSMGETSLVRWLRAGPCSGQIQAMQRFGNSLGMGVTLVRAEARVPVGPENCTPSHSGSVQRNHLMLELCCVDVTVSVQAEHAMLGRDQGFGVGTRRIESDEGIRHAAVCAGLCQLKSRRSCWNGR